ncbi:collagen alpha-1(I) chain-like [Lethenteron reissneri]|uniref:collagen alpha-1(I) chain-like n=1 Tax=Lethenteron reissneri TaxID=7753 RepID=UPI002AB62FC3|nr:collagen alpha-1(I) chain-like [Lethenteron reissneri]
MTPSGSYPGQPPRARDPADPALELLREQHAELRALTQRHGEQIATLLVDGPRGTPREGARGPAAVGPAPGEGTAFGGTFGTPRSGAGVRGPTPKGPLRRRVKGTAAVAVAADSKPRHRNGECARLEDPRATTRHPDDDNGGGGGGGEGDRGDGRGEEDPEQRGDVALILGLLGSSRARGPPPERNPTRPPSSSCRGARGRGGARPPRAPVDCDLRRSENEAVRAWLRGAAARARVARGARRREARRRREGALRESRERERRGEQSARAVRAWMEAKRREGGRGRGGAAEGGSAPGGQRGESKVEHLKEKRKTLTQIKHGDTGTLRERGATGTERERAQGVGSPTKKGVTGIEGEKGGPMFLKKRGGIGTQREQCAGSPKEKEGKGTVGRKGELGAPVELRAPGKRGVGPRIRTGTTGTEREQRSEAKRDTRCAALLVRKEGAWPQKQQRVEALEGKGSSVTPSEKGGTEQGARPQMEQGGTESVKRIGDTGICREQGDEPVQVKGSAVTPSEKGDARPTGGERGAVGDAEGEGRERKGGRVSLPATTPSQGPPVKGFRGASGGRGGPRTPSTHEAELVSSLARRRKGALRGWGSRVGRTQEAQGTEGIAEPALGPEGNGVEPQQIPAWLKGARLPPTALSRLMEKLRVGDDGERKGVQRGALEPLGVRPDPQGCAAPQNLGL